ncbi:MAG: hypothetical protein ACTHU1_13325 [Arachnia sp.]
MMRTITRMSTFCMRCGVVSESVVVPSSAETVELADALQRLGWAFSGRLDSMKCPGCAHKWEDHGRDR